MLTHALGALKNYLNSYLKTQAGVGSSAEDRAIFFEDQGAETSFKENTVSILIINIEEEKTLRNADPYIRVEANGKQRKVNPDIRLNLYVLFVARFKKYPDALNHLSWIIQYFQSNSALNHENAPDLHADIDQLVMELVTQSFSEQNEMWSLLRTAYQPSLLYKVKMVVFRDAVQTDVVEVDERILRTRL